MIILFTCCVLAVPCICLLSLLSDICNPLPVLLEVVWCHATAGHLSSISSSAPWPISAKTLAMLVELLLEDLLAFSWIYFFVFIGFVQDILFLFIAEVPVCNCFPLPNPSLPPPHSYHKL